MIITTLGTERHVNLMDEAGKRMSIISRSGGSPERVDFGRIEPLIRQSDYVALNIVDYCRPIIPLIEGSQQGDMVRHTRLRRSQSVSPRFH